ncbi:DUF2914 domain-containing protein [Thiomicrorhabdus sp.]|uniref:DUF2914 domain-containing protein n=1 Tax=Thiomicrorhabdus sp. TaxID=2039724 RepID=UPI0029C9877E|nr:DUF2914 domain-containing protein [Thiomicrorhabdus sp.]
MRLPDTQNANYLYAFKKGYRAAIDGKKLTDMPSAVRRDDVMRGYFMQGWENAQEELTSASGVDESNPWKHRAVWTSITLLAGLLTAALIINNVNEEQTPAPSASELKTQTLANADNANLIDSNPVQHSQPTEAKTVLPAPQESDDKPQQSQPIKPASQPPTQNAKDTEKAENALSLLTTEARKDAELNRQEFEQTRVNDKMALEPVATSPIQIKTAVLTAAVRQHEPTEQFSETVPKYIRSIKFFTHIKVDKPQTIYHRWRYKDRIMATVALRVQPGGFRTWSSKNLTSAWQGQWYVEILDQNHQVIHRKAFIYGALEE